MKNERPNVVNTIPIVAIILESILSDNSPATGDIISIIRGKGRRTIPVLSGEYPNIYCR